MEFVKCSTASTVLVSVSISYHDEEREEQAMP